MKQNNSNMPINPIRLSKSIVGSLEAEAVAKVILNDGCLGMGKEVKAFEEDIAKFLGVPMEWVVCVNSGEPYHESFKYL